MSGYRRQGNRGGFDSRNKLSNAGPRMEWKPKGKVDVSLESASCSQNDKSSNMLITEESAAKDVVCGVDDLKLASVSGNDDDNSQKVKQFGDKSQNEDVNGRLSHTGFDICQKGVSSVIKLKPPLHKINRDIRNQNKQSMKGKNIIFLRPGMVLMKGYISFDDQVSIVKTCRDLGISAGGFYQPGYSSGTKLHLKMFCLGKNWDPESSKYTEFRPFDKSKPQEIPEKFQGIVKKAIQDSNEFIQGGNRSSDEGRLIPTMSPDICIVNFYNKSGRLGLHQDKDESETSLRKELPVVSFSLGDSAEFLYGETRSIDEAEKVILESGDVLIFGGKSRLIYHGVTSICPDTAPTLLIEATDMSPGRLNLTFRKF
ncbi:hypothetical protein QVD17_32506 [Tagetes erecta]|uniref:Fe2OG dioxygenase domain-containing protein n=1 Tax=Tagetes erecta TaxID=13708 RepID=A0AAD8JXW1_TARER|nr:hypothetical protein QVD17_32506 [Tagetes erecta]